MFDFKNKIVIVTGGLRGIGLEIATQFAKQGGSVLIADKDQKTADELVPSLVLKKSLDINHHYLDLEDLESCEALLDYVKSRYKRLDVLINNARGGTRESVSRHTPENWDTTFNVNLKGAFFLSRACIEFMQTNDSGSIINLSSVSASYVSPESVAYQLSKAGLEQLTKTLAVYGGQYGIRVNAIAPGFIVQEQHEDRFYGPDNESFRNTAYHYTATGYVGSSIDVANAALFLSSPMARFITGQVLNVDGGGYIQDPFHLLMNKP